MDSAVRQGMEAAHGSGLPTQLFGFSGIITTVTNTLLFAVGLLAVLMIIVGGLRYVVSGGSSTNVTAAKNTILYAIVGLVVAVLAFAIVNFVINAIFPGTNGGGPGFSNV